MTKEEAKKAVVGAVDKAYNIGYYNGYKEGILHGKKDVLLNRPDKYIKIEELIV